MTLLTSAGFVWRNFCFVEIEKKEKWSSRKVSLRLGRLKAVHLFYFITNVSAHWKPMSDVCGDYGMVWLPKLHCFCFSFFINRSFAIPFFHWLPLLYTHLTTTWMSIHFTLYFFWFCSICAFSLAQIRNNCGRWTKKKTDSTVDRFFLFP